MHSDQEHRRIVMRYLPLLSAFAIVSASPIALPAAPPSSAASVPAADAATLPLAQGEGRRVAEQLASELLNNFVIPANARDYAAMLRANAANGRYDGGTRGELA